MTFDAHDFAHSLRLDQVTVARSIVEKLGPMIVETEAPGLGMLSYLLQMARIEAEKLIAEDHAPR